MKRIEELTKEKGNYAPSSKCRGRVAERICELREILLDLERLE